MFPFMRSILEGVARKREKAMLAAFEQHNIMHKLSSKFFSLVRYNPWEDGALISCEAVWTFCNVCMLRRFARKHCLQSDQQGP